MKRNNIKNWEPDLLHMARQIQKMREADNWNGVSLKKEYADFLEYIERLRKSGEAEKLRKAEEFLKEHYEHLLGLKPIKK